jgi:DNA-binding NarL/FixJ family response regulator
MLATTVLIVDDHEPFRSAARRMLEEEGFRVVGEAGDGVAAIALARDVRPDIVLLDVVLPDLSGFDVADRLAGGPSTVVLVSSPRPGRLRPAAAGQPGGGLRQQGPSVRPPPSRAAGAR